MKSSVLGIHLVCNSTNQFLSKSIITQVINQLVIHTPKFGDYEADFSIVIALCQTISPSLFTDARG